MAEELKLSGKTVKCPVCEKNTALEEEAGGVTSWLCANCGYTSNTTFDENSEELKATPQSIIKMKFSDVERGIIWIPTVINMASRGLIYPEKYGKQIMWIYIPMTDIPEEEQKNYPIAGQPGKFFKQKVDPDNAQRHTQFYSALKEMGAIIELDELNENVKEEKNDVS